MGKKTFGLHSLNTTISALKGLFYIKCSVPCVYLFAVGIWFSDVPHPRTENGIAHVLQADPRVLGNGHLLHGRGHRPHRNQRERNLAQVSRLFIYFHH